MDDQRESRVVAVHGNNAGADWGALTTPVAEFAGVIAPHISTGCSASSPSSPRTPTIRARAAR